MPNNIAPIREVMARKEFVERLDSFYYSTSVMALN